MLLNPYKVHRALKDALNHSRIWAAKSDKPNSTRSSRFLSDVCRNLDELVRAAFSTHRLNLRYISVDEYGNRHAGEWLLDGIWTHDEPPCKGWDRSFPVRVRCALECESSTNTSEFYKDFDKLLVIHSDIKIFLAGLNHLTESGAFNYQRDRVRQIENLFIKANMQALNEEWYLAFWPSPLNVKGQSLWDHLDSGKYDYLSEIFLYHWSNNSFQLVTTEKV